MSATKVDFDLKTAVSLLPTMNDTEKVTIQLIDAIELYSTMITQESIQLLIQVVMKTRLSHSAKLRLNNTYNTIPEMVAEMKKHLLTTKSSTALQKKLFNCYQGTKTVDQFGSELEQLFVNLTIAQANGEDSTYSILKPINEKQAIHRFANGLRNEHLRTIIGARNYGSLKDAIQGAKDEEISMTPSSSGQMFTARDRPYQNFKNHNNRGRPYLRNHFNSHSTLNKNDRTNTFSNTKYSRGNNRGNFTRGRRTFRGSNRYYHSNNSQKQNHNNYVNITNESKNEDDTIVPKQFFRD